MSCVLGRCLVLVFALSCFLNPTSFNTNMDTNPTLTLMPSNGHYLDSPYSSSGISSGQSSPVSLQDKAQRKRERVVEIRRSNTTERPRPRHHKTSTLSLYIFLCISLFVYLSPSLSLSLSASAFLPPCFSLALVLYFFVFHNYETRQDDRETIPRYDNHDARQY